MKCSEASVFNPLHQRQMDKHSKVKDQKQEVEVTGDSGFGGVYRENKKYNVTGNGRKQD